jgi:glutamate racemase
VLGCTHYELVADQIRAAVGAGPVFFGSAGAVAAQAVRRVAAGARERQGGGRLLVLRSGRVEPLPPEALRYPAGRAIAAEDSVVAARVRY